MLPFSGFGPFDRSERKALLFAILFSCLFIVIFAFARPHPRLTRISTNNFHVPPPPTANRFNEPELSTVDSLEKFRIRPEHFEQVDFKNYSYGPYTSRNGTKIDLTLEQSELRLPNHSGWFTLKDVYYTDMTGDGRAEAIVWLYHVTCGASCDGVANVFYIYTERNGKLKPIWQYETGSYADGCGLLSFTAGGTQIVLELFGRCPKPGMDRPASETFVVKDLTFMLFEFNGRRFTQKSLEFFESSALNVKNYEPGIRIY